MGWMNREPAEPELPSDLNKALDGLRKKVLECPRPELLQAAHSDVLPAEQKAGITQHLEHCLTCQRLLADLESVDDTPLDRAGQAKIWKKVRAAIAAEEPASASKPARAAWWNSWFRPAPLAAMAAAVFLVVVGSLWMLNRQRPTNEVAQNHPIVELPAPPPSVLQLEKAPVVLPVSGTIVWRGQDDETARQAKALERALAPYESGDYPETVLRLERLRRQYPRMAQVPFYLGVSELFLNKNEEAARNLSDAAKISNSPVSDDALWYLALANHRLGKDDLASSTLESLCRAKGKNSAKACAGAKELGSRR